ncbi:hypothetical protein NXC14_CH00595 [Rhizobium sp. NXC14]|nr:hypothetical protein NXC14_CH00595 [Rhizobium sp. NXC14]
MIKLLHFSFSKFVPHRPPAVSPWRETQKSVPAPVCGAGAIVIRPAARGRRTPEV